MQKTRVEWKVFVNVCLSKYEDTYQQDVARNDMLLEQFNCVVYLSYCHNLYKVVVHLLQLGIQDSGYDLSWDLPKILKKQTTT